MNVDQNEFLLDIIIPVFNEESRLAPTIFELADYFYHFEKKIRVLCIMNGCHDRTLEVVKNCKILLGNFVDFVEVYEKLGKGGAILKGLELASADYISFVDADGSVRAAELFKLLKNIGDYDAIIGSRHLKGAKILVPQKFSRKVAGRLYNLLVRWYLKMPFKDTQCGAKIYRKDAAKIVARECAETGWGFDVAMLQVLLDHQYRIKEFPVRWINDERSKIKLVIDGGKMLKALIQLKRNQSFKNNLKNR